MNNYAKFIGKLAELTRRGNLVWAYYDGENLGNFLHGYQCGIDFVTKQPSNSDPVHVALYLYRQQFKYAETTLVIERGNQRMCTNEDIQCRNNELWYAVEDQMRPSTIDAFMDALDNIVELE